MKNLIKILIINFFLLFAMNVNAQRVGLQLGTEIPDFLEGAHDPVINFQEFLTFGPTVDFELTDNMFFSTGLIGSFANTKGFGNYDNKLSFDSEQIYRAEIPLLFRFVKDVKENQIHIQFGSNLRSRIRYHETRVIRDLEEGVHTEQTINKTFDRVTFGSQFGIGYQVKSFRFGLDVKTEVMNLSEGLEFQDKIFNGSLALSVNYTLGNFIKPKHLYK